MRVGSPESNISIAMTRSFGDFHLKKNVSQPLSSPNTTDINGQRNYDFNGILSVIPTIDRMFVPNVNGMEIFIIIASDGFWVSSVVPLHHNNVVPLYYTFFLMFHFFILYDGMT
jgi:serine/threonine protein phosphatase PrpC